MEGESEVHTTELTAFSAAVMTPDLSNEENHYAEVEPQQLQEQQEQEPQQRTVARFLPFFKASNVGADTSMPSTEQQQQQQQQPNYFFSCTAAATSTTLVAAATTTTTHFFSSSTTSSSLFPPSSSSTSSDLTAAWVASTPFSAAASVLCGGGGDGGGANDSTLHFLAPMVTTTSDEVASMTTATTSTMGVSPPQQPQPQPQQQQHSQRFFYPNTTRSAGNKDSASQFNQHPPPQFITPSYGLIRFPNNNFGGGGGGGDHFTFAHNATTTTTMTATLPHFIGPSSGAVGAESLSNNNNGFKTPVYIASNSSVHLGRHWKQMGCHTRQYLQPSIPLPASTRLTSAAKHLRGASLGGPPGSLSPLTPNKSWAQIVASSTPRQNKPHQQQQQQHPSSQSVLTAPSSSGTSLKRPQQQQQPPIAVTSGVAYNKVAAAAVVPPPQFGGGGVGKPAKNASLRAITGLGVSTSSNRDFKSLLLRLKTALEKEKEKWRPKCSQNGGGGGAGGGEDLTIGSHSTLSDGGDNNTRDHHHHHHAPVVIIGGKQRDECIFWLAWILRKFQFSAETMSLSVALFDAVLTASSSSSSSLSVTAANCKLVVLVCMQLSAKFSEEDADVPTTRDLLAVSEIGADCGGGGGGGSGGGGVSMEAALKMERVILTALDWDLNRPTPLKFLEILHTLLMCHQPQLLEDAALGLTPVKHLERLTWKMQRIVANHQLALCYRPAVLAVALLSLDLESIGVSDWQLVSAALEKICQIGGGGGGPGGEDRHQISRCKNLIVRLLAGDRKGLSAPAAATTASGGGVGRGGGRANNEAEVSEAVEKKRSMTKLKRKHVPSESCGGGFIIDAAAASAVALAASSTASSAASSSSSSTTTTLKRVFNIAESPTCKSEARSEEEAAASRGSLAAADRFQALQGLCINIY